MQSFVCGQITTAGKRTRSSTPQGCPRGASALPASRIGLVERESARTTPESPDLQPLLREMARSGAAACVMEVSSHALVLYRADFIRFAAGVFTNLTRDHLDFHDGMEDYCQAKRRLFDLLPEGAPAIVNADDPYGARLAADRPHAVTYGINRPADIAAGPVVPAVEGLRFDVRTPRGLLHIDSPLTGRDAYNVLAAAATAVRSFCSFVPFKSRYAMTATFLIIWGVGAQPGM